MVVPTFYQPDDELSQKYQTEVQQEIQLGQDVSRMPKVVLLLQFRSDQSSSVLMQFRKVYVL